MGISTLLNLCVNVVNEQCETPLHEVCYLCSNTDTSICILRLLLANGADINAQTARGDTVLHNAVRYGNLELVKYLVRREELCVDVVNEHGNTPLHEVCYVWSNTETSIRILRLLLANGADINAQTHGGDTVLHNAVRFGNLEFVGYLVSRKELCVDVVNKQGETPLHKVCKDCRTEISLDTLELLLFEPDMQSFPRKVTGICDRTSRECENPLHVTISRAIADMLLAAGADVTDTDCRGDTVLHMSARLRQLEVFKCFISRKELCVNVVNKLGETPLHVVCKGRGTEISLRILRLLLANGADMNAQTNIGRTPLHYACNMSEPVTTMRELLSNGAKLDIADCKGDYPIHTPCDEPLELLNVNSVDISSLKDANGRTMLHIAAKIDDKDVVESIVAKFSSVNTPDNIGKTPLHYAALNSGCGVISFLIANGATINAVDTWGQTALHEAARIDNVHALKELLADSCDVNARDLTGVTALHVACLHNSVLSLKLLLSDLADINCCDNNKSSPLHFAAWNDENYRDDEDNPVTNVISLFSKSCVDIFQKDALDHTCLDIAIFRRNCKIYSALTEQAQISHTSELVNQLSNVANMDLVHAEVLELIITDGVRRSIADAEQYVSHVLTLPGVGQVTDEDEAKDIQAAINDMIKTLAERIGHVDSRFKCVVLHAGSMSEGTKTRLPDEFDFLFCLEEFSKRCESDYAPNELCADGVLAVRIKDIPESETFKAYSGSNFMQHIDMNRVFSELVTKTIFDTTFPKHPQLMPTVISADPVLLVRWRGAMYKQLIIHIDIVPALLLPHWHETTRKDSVLMTPDILHIPCIAVSKHVRARKQDVCSEWDLWRSSMSLVETCIFRKLRPEIRNSYIACKALVTSRILPVIDDPLYGNVERVLSSYRIKMSFLLVVEKKANRDGLDSVYSKPTTGNAMNIDETTLNQSKGQKDETIYMRSDKDRVKEKQETMHSIYYGPASKMNVAEQYADFDMKLVREVFQRLEEGIANRFLPSIFNANVNVLSNMDADSITLLVYIKLIRKLIE